MDYHITGNEVMKSGDSYRPGERDSRKIVKDSPEFIKRLARGKEAEERLALYLANLGAKVKDISCEVRKDGHYSPFDLTARFTDVKYIMDCKSWRVFPKDRRFRNYIAVSVDCLTRWEEYNTNYEKLLMLEVEEKPSNLYFKMYNTYLVDFLFIRIDDIRTKGVITADRKGYKISKPHLRLFRRIKEPNWAIMW